MPPATPPPLSGKKLHVAELAPVAASRATGRAGSQTAEVSLLCWICFGISAIVFITTSAVLVRELFATPDTDSHAYLGPGQTDQNRLTELSGHESVGSAQRNDVKDPVADVAPEPPPKRKNEEPPPEPIARKSIFDDIVAKGRCFSLPDSETGNACALCHIDLSPSDNLQLKLDSPSLDKQPILKPDDSPAPDGMHVWSVFSRYEAATGGGTETKIGQFKLVGQSLFFEWDLDAPSWTEPLNLKLCKLDLSVGSIHETCRLIQTTKQNAGRVDFKTRKGAIPIAGLNFSRDITKLMYYDIALTLGDWSSVKEGISVSETRPQKFQIPSPTDDGDGQVDIQFTYVPSKQDSPAQFTYQTFVYLRYVDIKEPDHHLRFKRARIDELDAQSKEGVVFSDLDRLRRKAQADLKLATKQVSDVTLEEYQQILNFGPEAMEQINRINSHMTDIKQQLRVQFSVYLKTDSSSADSRIVLVETDPPSSPSKDVLVKGKKPEVAHVDFHRRNGVINVPNLEINERNKQVAFYDIELRLGDWSGLQQGISINDSQAQSFQIPPPANNDDGQVDIQFRFVPSTQIEQAQFVYQSFIFLRYLETKEPDPQKRVKRARIDERDAPSADGFELRDLNRVRRKFEEDLHRVRQQYNKDKKRYSDLHAKHSTESEPTPELQKLQESLDKFQQVLDFGPKAVGQFDQIAERLEFIKEKLEVRYSVYLQEDAGSAKKVVLVETDPPPFTLETDELTPRQVEDK